MREPPYLIAFALLIEFVAVVGILVLIGLDHCQDSVGLSSVLGILGVTRSMALKKRTDDAEGAPPAPAPEAADGRRRRRPALLTGHLTRSIWPFGRGPATL